MPGFASQVADVGGTSSRYFVGGEGPPVILVHGLNGAATNWTELAPLLGRRRRVLVPDLPGHGRSEPLPGLHDLGALAAAVGAIAERERMLPAPVVGHSMGGAVALRIAADRPADVDALVLIESAGITSTTRRAEIALALAGVFTPARKASRFRHAIARRRRLRQAVLGYWGAVDARGLTPAAVLGFLEGAALSTDYASAAGALVRADPRLELDRVRCPALVVWGARDRVVPLADGFEFARRLRAPIRTIPAAGHLLIGERPRECAEVVEEFLDRVREVDELPVDAELRGDALGERLDA